MSNTHFNVVLVPITNPAYVSWGRSRRAESKINSAETTPCPSQAISHSVEEFARNYLSQYLELSDRRILSYKTRNWNGSLLSGFTELDAVCRLEQSNSIIIVEVKHSSRRAALKKARKQLMTAETILSALYKHVILIALMVEPQDYIFEAGDDKALSPDEFLTENPHYQLIESPLEAFDHNKMGLIMIKGVGLSEKYLEG